MEYVIQAACIALFESNVPDDFGARERTDCLAGIDEEGTRYFVLEDAGGALLDCGGYAAHPRAVTAGLVWGMIRRDLHGPGPGTRLLAARSARIRAQGRFNCVLVETTPMSRASSRASASPWSASKRMGSVAATTWWRWSCPCRRMPPAGRSHRACRPSRRPGA